MSELIDDPVLFEQDEQGLLLSLMSCLLVRGVEEISMLEMTKELNQLRDWAREVRLHAALLELLLKGQLISYCRDDGERIFKLYKAEDVLPGKKLLITDMEDDMEPDNTIQN